MKKLTAGIFTVMMGLCATNGADAAVASKGYVDTKVGVNTQSITELTQTVTDNKTAADTAIADEKSARESAVSGLDTRLTSAETTIGEQATAISGINTKLESVATTEGLADLTSDVTALQTRVGEGTVDSRIATAKQAAIDTAAADATSKAEQALADAKADAEKYIDAAELANSQSEQNTAIENAYKAADKAITDSIGAVAEGKTVVEMIADAQATATYDDTTVKADITKNAQAIAANETAIETNAGNITSLQGLVGTTAVADQIAAKIAAENLSQYETVEGALAKYEQISKLKALAYKDKVGTDDIEDGAVTADKLGANAVTNAAVADDALSQSKISGLDTTLAAKLNIPTVANETDGKYVLTATSVDGQASYYWELIERGGTTAE